MRKRRALAILIFIQIAVHSGLGLCSEENGVTTWAKYLNISDRDIPTNTFKIWYFNTNNPADIKLTEVVDQVSFKFTTKNKKCDIRAEEVGAFIAGYFKTEGKQPWLLESTHSYAKIRIILDNKVIYDKEKSSRFIIPINIDPGRHKIEIEYIAQYHVADLLLKMGVPGDTYTAPQVKQYLEENTSEVNPIWYVGVYESKKQTNNVDVMLSRSKEPVVLILVSYDPVNWVIHRNGNKIQAVIFYSVNPGGSAKVLEDRHSKIMQVAGAAPKPQYKLIANWWPGVEDLSDKLKSLLGSMRLHGFSGIYSASEIQVPTITKP